MWLYEIMLNRTSQCEPGKEQVIQIHVGVLSTKVNSSYFQIKPKYTSKLYCHFMPYIKTILKPRSSRKPNLFIISEGKK